jgi:hypothetical protein
MKYEIVLTIRNEDKFESLDKIQADDLLHLASQLTFVLLNIQRKEHDEEMSALRMKDDDIPF